MRSVIAIALCLLLAGCGDGALKRMTTVSGVYAVCKPDGYPFICFLDADSTSGGLSCQPFNGECKK